MSNLGKISVMFLTAVCAYGSVTAAVDREMVRKGETVTLTLSIEGDVFTAPLALKLCANETVVPQQREIIEEREGRFNKIEQLHYSFEVQSDCVVEPLRVVVDGVEHFTPPISIGLYQDGLPAGQTVRVAMKSSKPVLYVGEPFEVEVTLIEPEKTAGSEQRFRLPGMKDIWVKKRYDVTHSTEGHTLVQKRRYLLAPQQAGDLYIGPAEVQVAYDREREDAWGNRRAERYWERYRSNALAIRVNPLPEGVTAVGRFTLAMQVVKRKVESNEPVHAEVTLQGSGNFEDIVLPPPVIRGVTVYADEPTLEAVAGSGEERWRQQLTFVAADDFTIPSLKLACFDPETEQTERLQTEAVTIRVAHEGKRLPGGQGAAVQKRGEEPMMWMVMYIMGVLSTVMFFKVPWRKYLKKREKESDADSGHRRALSLLLNHKDDAEVRAMIEQLERYLYAGTGEGIDEKALKKVLKDIRGGKRRR